MDIDWRTARARFAWRVGSRQTWASTGCVVWRSSPRWVALLIRAQSREFTFSPSTIHGPASMINEGPLGGPGLRRPTRGVRRRWALLGFPRSDHVEHCLTTPPPFHLLIASFLVPSMATSSARAASISSSKFAVVFVAIHAWYPGRTWPSQRGFSKRSRQVSGLDGSHHFAGLGESV